MKETYQITVNRPDGASVTELKIFIKDALESWGGQKHPEEPLFNSLTPVTNITRITK